MIAVKPHRYYTVFRDSICDRFPNKTSNGASARGTPHCLSVAEAY